MIARVMIAAGSDSGGGAGIQADIKTVTALGGYAMTAITALTAQNTQGVFAVQAVDSDFIRWQLKVCLTDIGADVIKTGMLHSAEVIEAVVVACDTYARGVPLVVDPVMVAKGGAPLLKPEARHALIERLVPKAAILTPNVPEATALTGVPIESEADLIKAADHLLLMGPGAVLIKGGHLPGPEVVDHLRTADGGWRRFASPRLDTPHTHGTGCTLASAIATGVAEGFTLEHAVARAREYVLEAIRLAPGLGRGHGPLLHGHPLTRCGASPKA